MEEQNTTGPPNPPISRETRLPPLIPFVTNTRDMQQTKRSLQYTYSESSSELSSLLLLSSSFSYA